MNKILDDLELNYLRELKKRGLEVIIAGGAVRDMVKNLPYNDVDFFINIRSGNLDLCRFLDEDVPEVFGEDFSLRRNNIFDPSFNSRANIVNIANGEVNGSKFQLIFNKGNLSAMVKSNFDLGCCKVYHDGDSLKMTHEFEHFLTSNVIGTHLPPKEVSQKTILRAQKFANRFGSELGPSIVNAIEFHKKEEENELVRLSKIENSKKLVSWKYVTGDIAVPTAFAGADLFGNTVYVNTQNDPQG